MNRSVGTVVQGITVTLWVTAHNVAFSQHFLVYFLVVYFSKLKINISMILLNEPQSLLGIPQFSHWCPLSFPGFQNAFSCHVFSLLQPVVASQSFLFVALLTLLKRDLVVCFAESASICFFFWCFLMIKLELRFFWGVVVFRKEYDGNEVSFYSENLITSYLGHMVSLLTCTIFLYSFSVSRF